MKRVLFISYIFPPMVAGGAPRVSQFTKYLPQFGWEPTVLTVPVAPAGGIDEQTLAELPPEVKIVRAYCPLDSVAGRGKSVARNGFAGWKSRVARKTAYTVCVPDRQILWYPWAVRAGKEILQREHFDAILATHGPASNLIIGAKLARHSGLPLVVDFRDLWADNPAPVWPTSFHRHLSRRLEHSIVGRAAKVIGVTPAMAAHLADRHGRRKEDVVPITNGFDPDDLPLAVDRRELSDATRPLRICYAGSVYGGQDPSALFQAISTLAREGAISPQTFQVEFVGNLSPDEPRRFGVEAFVESHPAVPHREVFAHFAQADALMMMEGPGYCVTYSYAGKVFDYLLTGKPILGLIEAGGNSARLLEQANLGIVAHPQREAEIRAALRQLLPLRNAPPRPVDIDSPPLAAFNRRKLTERLSEVLNAARHVAR